MDQTAYDLMSEAALEPTLDELALRAQSALAAPFPSDEELMDMVRFWRAQRAARKVKG